MADFAELGLGTETSGLKKGQDELGRLAQKGADTERKVTASTEKIGQGFRNLAKVATVALGAAGIALGIGQGIKVLADFGKSMAQVQAITRATDDQMKALRETAKQLGSTTEFTAAQAADGMRFLGMAGFSAAESLKAIPAVLDLATASGEGLASTADIASNILSGFGLGADQAGRAADVLAAASSRSNTNVAQLGHAMSVIAPVSKSLGISLEDTAAAIGTLSDSGIQGERAGTALRGVLASIASPTQQATDALAKYGLTARDVDPATRSFADVLETLRAANISAADAIAIFGREAATGALVLASGAKRVREFGQELTTVQGAAAEMARVMRDQLGGDIASLGSALEGLIIELGDAGVAGGLRAVIQGATDFTRLLTTGVQPAVERLSSYMGTAAVASVIIYRKSIVAATVVTYRFVASLVATRTAMIKTFVGAVLVGIAEVIYQFTVLADRLGSTGQAFALLGDIASDTFAGIGDSAKAITPAIGAVLQSAKAEFIDFEADVQLGWAQFIRGLANLTEGVPFLSGTTTSLRNAAIEAGSGLYELEQAARDARAEGQKLQSTAEELATNGIGRAAGSLAILQSYLKDLPADAGTSTDAVKKLNDALGDLGVPTTPTTPKDVAGASSGASAGAGVGQIIDLGVLTDDANRATQSLFSVGDAAQALKGGFTTLFSGIIGQSGGAASAVDQLKNSVLQLGLSLAQTALFGGGSSGGGGFLGGLLTSILGGGGGGSGAPIYSVPSGLNSSLGISGDGGSFGIAGLGSTLFGGVRAGGGDVSPGNAYLIGERGPEMFVPGMRGGILPAGANGSGVNVNFQVVNNVPGAEVSQRRERGPSGEEIIVATVNKAGSRGQLSGIQNRFGLQPVVKLR